MKKLRFRTLFRIVWAMLGLGFVSWLIISTQAKGVSDAVKTSDARIRVTETMHFIAFEPQFEPARAGLIFYPGAMIDPDAYSPITRRLAENGYNAVVMKLPYRNAPFESHRTALFERTREYIERYPGVIAWSLAGHSRGGALAAMFAHSYAPSLDGLILIGTTHPKELDLSGVHLHVTKIYGSEDGLASEREIRQYANNLPEHTIWIRIEGGNHAQFGWYGSQLGDSPASISREEQQKRMLDAIKTALEKTLMVDS